ncbi:MAG TPA: 2-amino-4-hydroxy-6-hydroxymethyldihydropteridine diphosphokinase [Edaphobacter sp.]
MSTTELTLPHPEMHVRRFVLEPLSEIAPDWRHPALNLAVRELLREL